MRRLILLIISSVLTTSVFCSGPDTSSITANELILKQKFEELYNSFGYSQRDSLNNEIIKLFTETLSMDGSFDYSWTQLSMIGRIKSEDNKVRIFTWYLEKNPDEFLYYGFIKLAGGKDTLQSVYFLKDMSAGMIKPENLRLDPGNWYGALYYGIRTFRYRQENFYALFGYDHNNMNSDKKLIEVLTFTKNHEPVFEGDFKMNNVELKRVIFEYSSSVAMSLRYNPRLRKIVFDHLSPLDPMLSNNRRYYVPDGIYDAFTFNKGVFMLEHDVDARNY